ncbi:CAP domain-containing protein [Desulfovibrio litoralis]|uniref:Uncharacterized conserved protein YkwD, contains CAP (CSP/antigen 5/PR1) domain n=1 Tax=Desulfovibrio litoralis DSM 11393 TaxID=1121455 RepID=A0A1M7T913_9BACT|nr:CAP domain-containing protein [Desulfovibrio litoralis]SHN67178.1 Uncharacterized conserved protein YkwD, contains CAP (CSP/antigen 5/PR1) domain [Desulfovibrio litoralis DSM 11393]
MKLLKSKLKSLFFVTKLGFVLLLSCVFLPNIVLAQFADDSTVIAYMIEMYRKGGVGCDGSKHNNLSPLTISEPLKKAAEQTISGKDLKVAISEQGLTSVTTMLYTIPKLPPKQAFEAIKAQDCNSLMGNFNNIGVFDNGDRIVVVLADVHAASRPGDDVPVDIKDTDRWQMMQQNKTEQAPPIVPVKPYAGSNIKSVPLTEPEPVQTAQNLQTPPIAKTMEQAKGSGNIAGQETTVVYQGPDGKQVVLGTMPSSQVNSNNLPVNTANDANKLVGNMAGTVQTNANTVPVQIVGSSGVVVPINNQVNQPVNKSVNTPVNNQVVTPVPVPQAASRYVALSGEPLLLLDLLNDARSKPRQCGSKQMPAVPALRPNSALTNAAIKHVQNMAQNNFFGERSPDGVGADARISAEGFRWTKIEELLAKGQFNAQATFNTWINNPFNCEKIMSPSFDSAGIAFEPNGGKIWVLDLVKGK